LLIAFSFVSKREWMPGFRYELPFVPVLMLFFSIGIHQVLFSNENKSRPDWKAYISKLGVLFCLGIFLLYPTVELQKSRHYTDELNRAHVALGKWLKEYAPRDASYASWDMGAVPYYSELPTIIEIHPEGILSTFITHNGYDVNYFLSLKPSFMALPPEPNPSRADGVYAFYSSDQFKQNYQLIFSFAFRRDYILAVYKHREVYIPQQALDEGKRLAEHSLADAYSDTR
jgi:hypothetical protein